MGLMVARRLAVVVVSLLCVLAVGLAFGGVSAFAERGHVFEKTFGSAGPGDAQLSEPQGVAVNEATGDVYVADRGNHRVEQFTSSGAFVAVWGWGVSDGASEFEVCTSGCQAGLAGSGEGQLSSPEGIAIDNDPSSPSYGDVYVVDGKALVEKFSANGSYINTVSGTQEGEGLYGVGVDKKGQLWVYGWPSFFEVTVVSFTNEASNTFIASRRLNGVGFPCSGFTVDSEDNLYINKFCEFSGSTIQKYDSEGKVLNEAVDGEQASAVAVDLSNDDAYIDNIETVARFTPGGEQIERLGAGQLVHGTGVGIDSASESAYVADSSMDTIDVFAPEPSSKPLVKGDSVSAVTGSSAMLSAEISPQGSSTSYRFEYGACASRAACASSGYEESAPIPDGSIGGGWQVHSVSVNVQDLKPYTAYHFRAVATNELGTDLGEGQAFSTQALGGELLLANGREWEMVSPPSKEGALFYALDSPSVEAGAAIQASVNGDAFTYLAATPIEAEPQGNANFQVSVFSTRGSSGWVSKGISTPHDEATGALGLGRTGLAEYRFFSEDLSSAIVEPHGFLGFTPLSPEATESTAYLRSDYLNGDVNDHCLTECFKPLVTAANVPAGTHFGEDQQGACGHPSFCGPYFAGATPDLSHIALLSEVALTGIPTPDLGGLYEWGNGQLQLVSVLPEGETNNQGGVAAASPVLGQGQSREYDEAARNAISSDGSRVIWEGYAKGGTETSTSNRHLYLRDTVKGETTRLDVFQGVPNGGEFQAPFYMTASVDGTRIFFLDAERLVPQSSPEGLDLYEYRPDAPEGSRLTDLSVTSNSGEAAGVANVLGASEDGSYVYFAAAGVLAPGASPGVCGGLLVPSVTKMCNLYVSHNGATRFIAALSKSDYPDWNGHGGVTSIGDLYNMTNRVTPSGHWLSFMSQRSLAGYDTRDAINGKPDEEVYLYDAETDRLTCASCNPTGARPIGQEYGSGPRLMGGKDIFDRTTQLASLIPGWTHSYVTESRYQSRYLLDSGRMFFESRDALAPQDVNGTWDVYEYEPAGVGGCTTGLTSFSVASNGCVSLISSGMSGEESAFMDASESGDDVFFITTAQLSAQDYDKAFDVYDAHQCSSRAPCFAAPAVSPPACDTGEACKPAQSAQPSIFGPGPSETFSGVGNVAPTAEKVAGKRSLTRAQRLARALKACKRVKGKRRRAACVRRAHKRYGKKGAAKGARSGRGEGSTRGVSARTGR